MIFHFIYSLKLFLKPILSFTSVFNSNNSRNIKALPFSFTGELTFTGATSFLLLKPFGVRSGVGFSLLCFLRVILS